MKRAINGRARRAINWRAMVWLVATATGACTESPALGSASECGNDVIDDDEACDGTDLGDQTCSDFGFNSGTVTCNADCELDTTGCSLAACGDGRVDGDEACDGDDLAGQSCAGLGFGPGNLVCDDCQIDTGGCGPLSCGDGIVDPGEACDGSDLAGESCASLGFAIGSLSCTQSCELNPFLCFGSTAECGDGVAEGDEPCDGDDRRGESCVSQGFDAGELSCTPQCELDLAACVGDGPACGDDVAEGDEACDGEDLRAMACEDFGFAAGSLSCIACRYAFFDCRLLAESVCGDGDATGFEACDGDDLRGQSCDSLGLGSGSLACAADCVWFELAGCSDVPTCGDNLAEGFEICDGFDLRGFDCDGLQLGSGLLACVPDCNAFDVAECSEAPQCGNNVAEALEVCDRFDLRGQTCNSLFLGEGVLACQSDCSGYVISGCSEAPICGDGVRSGYEVCDGEDLGFIDSCLAVGYGSGSVGCLPTCATLDLSGCGAPLACGLPGPLGLRQCDGDRLRGLTCEALGFAAGELGCNDNCSFDLSPCTP